MMKRFVVTGLLIVAATLMRYGATTRAQGPAGGNTAWSLHNGDLGNGRYAPLDEINVSNVGRMGLKWSFEVGAAETIRQVTPVVLDGVMYFNAGSRLYAINAATGTQIWTAQVEPAFPGHGRGPTYGGGRIYAYGRGAMFAVDAKTGAVVESFGNKGRLEVADAIRVKYPKQDATGYEMSSPPAYHNGTLYVGLALSEAHFPGGLLVALDGATGAVKWTFKTIPQVPQDEGWEIAKDTWRGGQRAGGGIWTQPAIDPELGLIYVNVANPSPAHDGSARKGINLFTNSIVALNLQTGKLAWYYQTVHHDIWEKDLVTGPILFDVNVGGRKVKAVASSGKNCFMYMWNRETGMPLHPIVETGVPTASDVPGEEPWPTQPIPYTAKGVQMQPFCQTYPIITNPDLVKRARQMYFPYSTKEAYIVSHGGSFFGPPAFSPRTGLLYVTGKNAAVALKVKPLGDTLRQGVGAIGFTENIAEGPFRDKEVGVPSVLTVTAYNPATGELVWQQEDPDRGARPGTSGTLVTAGDVLFQASNTGDFYAFDARSGTRLFTYTAKRSINSTPLTYRVNGKQHVTIVAIPNMVLTFALP